MPVLASTPEQENAPLASEDELFLGEMSQLSEEELILIIGMMDEIDGSGHMVYNSYTGHIINSNTGERYKIEKEFRIVNQALLIYAGMTCLIGALSSSDLAKILDSLGIIRTIASITVTTEIIKVVLIGGGVILISVSLYDILQNGIYVYKLVKIYYKD